ncbi:MAG: hypothetical protein AAGH87_10640 [Pseudomonadota bacterium]
MAPLKRLNAVALTAAILSAPALADGRETAPPLAGPPPLQAQSVCAPGACLAPPVTRRVVRRAGPSTQAAAAPQYDFSSFTGGVGADIATGPVAGGGRFVVVAPGKTARFSGIRSRLSGLGR